MWYPEEKKAIAKSGLKNQFRGSFQSSIKKLYNNGKSTREIGKMFNMTSSGIRYNLLKQCVELRPRGGDNRNAKRIEKETQQLKLF